jgi:hypothetical protein
MEQEGRQQTGNHCFGNSPERRNHSAASAFHNPTRRQLSRRDFKESLKMNRAKVRSAVAPAGLPLRGLPLRWIFAAAAGALALLTIPHAARSQGIVRGAHEGAYEGNRVAGPVGGVVGGAVGAGVGGAVGAVEGVFGVPYRGYHHCHGYRDHYGYFHCYR